MKLTVLPFLRTYSFFYSPSNGIYFSLLLLASIFIMFSQSNITSNAIRIFASLMHLINQKLKMFPMNDFTKFILNFILILSFLLQQRLELAEVLIIGILQNFHMREFVWKGWKFISQIIFCFGCYKWKYEDDFNPKQFLNSIIIFFMFIAFPKEKKQAFEKERAKKILKIKKSSIIFHGTPTKMQDYKYDSFLDFLSEALIFFNSKSGKIYSLNKKAVEIFSPSIPSNINELPPLLIFSPNQLSSGSSESILTSVLKQPPSSTTAYMTTILSISYKIVIHKISDQNYLLLMEKITNIANSNNLKIISYVAHEFRTPLNCINTMLDALAKKAPQNLKEAFIVPARDSLASLLSLVNDLLDMSQMMAEKFSLALSEFHLRQVTKNVVKLMSLQAELKGIHILYEEGVENIQEEIYSDPARLRQVLINLMSNAMKYTSHGWIKLKVKSIDSNLIELSVIDTGLGIKQEDQNKLLFEFGRLKNQEDKSLNNYGVGLGLVISNELAKELEGGNVGLKIESEWGKGSKFSFYVRDFNETDCKCGEVESLPTIPNLKKFKSKEENTLLLQIPTIKSHASVKKIQKTSSITSNYSLKKLQKTSSLTSNYFTMENDDSLIKKDCDCVEILVCDDNQFNILSLKLLLKNLGEECDSASLGELAINKVIEKLKNPCCNYYRLIFMDIEMPIMDGFETSKKIKEILNFSNAKSKIIACSGYDANEERRKALKAGMEKILVKPVMEKELRKIVNEKIDRMKIKSEEYTKKSESKTDSKFI